MILLSFICKLVSVATSCSQSTAGVAGVFELGGGGRPGLFEARDWQPPTVAGLKFETLFIKSERQNVVSYKNLKMFMHFL